MADSQTRADYTPLPRKTIFFYGLMDLPVMMTMSTVSVFVHTFYTTDLGLDLVAVANILLIGRLFDLLTDPLVGRLSDRTKTRWGRRRPWIALAVPLMMLGVYKLYLPEPPVSLWYMFGWMSVMWLGWTMILIPYYAWAAELTPDYRERSLVTGSRSFMGTAGQLAAYIAPTIALLAFGIGGTGEVMMMIGITVLILLPILTGLTLWKVPEHDDFVPSVMPLWLGMKMMWRNGPFKRLILAFWLNYTALAFTTSMFLYYVLFVVQEPKAGILGLSTFYVSNLTAVSFWVWLSNRIGKHRAWVASLLLISSVNPLYLIHGPGDFYWMLPIMAVTGFSAGAFAALPNSMKADVIDLDALRTGEDRAAIYFAVWSFAQKGAMSLAGWMALMGLALVGFDPKLGADADQPIWGLKILFGIAPSIFFLGSAWVAWRYPITEERHKRLRDSLKRKRARQAAPTVAE